MSKLENKKYTFWELIQKIGVKIPIIQRDYAQGRETKKVKTVRENFIDKLYEILNDDTKSIDLDFVYGTVKNGYLIPLDGQQRLTTLFLLHYYLALKENKLSDEVKKILAKFTYETRLSSREFIKLLIDNYVEYENIKESIKNQTWFFSEWENDPTIKSMLIMLDALEKKFNNSNNFFEELTKKEKITFSFLDLEDFKLSDELYVKMNARGKPLTDFENFKSRFEEFISDEEIKARLDNEWYDIFWKIGKEELEKNENKRESKNPTQKSDEMFLNFFKNITAFYSQDFNEVDIFKFKYNIPTLIKKWQKNKPGTYNTLIKTKAPIDKIAKTLDCLIDYKNDLIYELRDCDTFKINVFQDFLQNSSDTKYTYEVRLRFYALMKFFNKIGKAEDNEILFKQWMRVCLNLINNASPYAILNEYIKLKELLDVLSNLLLNNNFYNEFSNFDYKEDLPKYINEQFKEEKLKAKLICKNLNWEQAFIKAEQHWYLDGQIRFLIEYSKSDERQYVLGYFIKYTDKFKKLWDFARVGKNNQILIHRALLTYSNYLPRHNKTDKYTFCTFGTGLREKNENWRNVFGGNSFKSLLDDVKTIDSCKIKLKSIIDSYRFHCNDWRSCFINPKKDWSVLDTIKNYQIYHKNQFNIRLNRGSSSPTSWGWSRASELYSYYLYRILRYELKIVIQPFSNKENLPWYYVSTEEPCCVIDNWNYNNHQFAIDIKFKDKKFSLEFFDRNNKLSEIGDKLKDILNKNNFQLKNRYINTDYDLYKQNDLITFLINLLKQFSEINT